MPLSHYYPKHKAFKKSKRIANAIVYFLFFVSSVLMFTQCIYSINLVFDSAVFCFFIYGIVLSLAICSYSNASDADVFLPNDIDKYQIQDTCNVCNQPQPSRCFHCDVCKACVLKREHHSIVLGVCVGFRNQKTYILFLIYSIILGIITATISLLTTVIGILSPKIQIPFVVVSFIQLILSVVLFAYGVFSMLSQINVIFCNQCSYGEIIDLSFLSNEETREHNPYDLGNIQNFKQIFGNNLLLCWSPFTTPVGDGIHFPTNVDLL
ncbi:Palmitoyltransferase [Entamoeba marina]